MNNCKALVKTATAFGAGLLIGIILPCECVAVVAVVTLVIVCFKSNRR